MDSMQEKYDSALLAILQNEGKIEKFLDVVFGFLRRRHFHLYILFIFCYLYCAIYLITCCTLNPELIFITFYNRMASLGLKKVLQKP